MQVTVNGEPLELEPGTTVRTLLERLSLGRGHVAVERNGRTLPRSGHVTTVLEPGDVLETIPFAAGG